MTAPDIPPMVRLLRDVAFVIAQRDLPATSVSVHAPRSIMAPITVMVQVIHPDDITSPEQLRAALAPWSAALGADICAYDVDTELVGFGVEGRIGEARVSVFGHVPRPVCAIAFAHFGEIAARHSAVNA